jgi:hypothetical protein
MRARRDYLRCALTLRGDLDGRSTSLREGCRARLVVCREFQIVNNQRPDTVDGSQFFWKMVRPERFELPASWFVARRSIQLSYGRKGREYYHNDCRSPFPQLVTERGPTQANHRAKSITCRKFALRNSTNCPGGRGPVARARMYGGEGGIRTLEGLLNHPKTLRNQQLADSQQVAVPCIPLISPSLAVELAVDAQLSVRSLYPTGTGHCRIVRKCALGSESVSAPHFDAVAKTRQPLVGSSGGPNHVPPSSASVRLAHKRR